MQKSSPKKVLVHQWLVNMEIERQKLHVSIRRFLGNLGDWAMVTLLPTFCGQARFPSIYPIMDINLYGVCPNSRAMNEIQ
jgi:hypothetical protein